MDKKSDLSLCENFESGGKGDRKKRNIDSNRNGWKWRTYCDRARSAVNSEAHDGYIPMDVREVIEDLCLWIAR